MYIHSFLFNMANFGNMEDEIPYPLPLTTVAPTTTAPVIYQVSTPSSTFDLNSSPSQHKKASELSIVLAIFFFF
jgi:hypothetical protein